MNSFTINFVNVTASEDYGSVENGIVVFSNSSGRGAESCYDISIINDMTLESNQTFLVLLSSADVDANLQNNMSIVTIVDDGDSKLFMCSGDFIENNYHG